MTIGHISDTHLGFRAYSKTTPAGFNQREVDVMNTFRACLNAIVERDPDVVVHAGDLFHMVRPSNHTIVAAYEAIAKAQRARGGKPFILIGGNHDTPRTKESGNLLGLFRSIEGVVLVPGAAEVLEFDDLDLEILAVPSQSLVQKENLDWVPTLGRRFSILTLHGMASQALGHAGTYDFDVAETRSETWSYVAMGDYHVHKAFGPNSCYSGSTDYTSTNIWEETVQPKGWIYYDTETSLLEVVPLSPRAVLDLPSIDASIHAPEAIQEAMILNARPLDEFDLPIVRQRVINAPSSLRGRIDLGVVRDIASRCLNYQLVTVPPRDDASSSHPGGSSAEGRRSSLEQNWDTHVDAAKIPVGIDRELVKTAGRALLQQVTETSFPSEELSTAVVETL